MEVAPGTAVQSASDQRVAWFERTYRVALPPDYIAVLKHANGAVPLASLFDQGRRERMIERILCLLDRPGDDPAHGWADITVVLSQLDARLVDDEELVGMNVIPIAALSGGDFVCLDYRGNRRSPVVSIWDHERSEELQPHLEKIAGSFGEFLGMLRKP